MWQVGTVYFHMIHLGGVWFGLWIMCVCLIITFVHTYIRRYVCTYDKHSNFIEPVTFVLRGDTIVLNLMSRLRLSIVHGSHWTRLMYAYISVLPSAHILP